MNKQTEPTRTISFRGVVVLTLLASVIAVLLHTVYTASTPAIEESRTAHTNALLEQFFSKTVENDPLKNRYTVELQRPHPALGTSVVVYPAYQNGVLQSMVWHIRANQGYSGTIDLLVGVTADKRIIGIDVLAHGETPGLGDRIMPEKTDWLHQFRGASSDRSAEGIQYVWRVASDGGTFDALTGATITARAVVAATREALIRFDTISARARTGHMQ